MANQFTVTIPVREQDVATVLDAFLDQRPYAPGPYQETVLDQAGNSIINPITKAMFVEDCIAYYVMDITRNYLISQAANSAAATATQQANSFVSELGTWINTQNP